MSTLTTTYSKCDDNHVVQFVGINEGDVLNFKGCFIELATYTEKDDEGNVLNTYENKPVVHFKDGAIIGLSKLTTHFENGKPVRTSIGELVKGRTKKEVEAQLTKLDVWVCSAVTEAVTKTGARTKEYTFEKYEG